MTDYGTSASGLKLSNLGVSAGKQQFAVQFSQEAALANGVRPLYAADHIFTLPAGTTLQGGDFSFWVVKVRG